jgi:hypothetical protein
MSKGKTGGLALTINYWHLKNEDPGMQIFAKERVENIFKSFEKLVDEYTDASYQQRPKKEDKERMHPLFWKSDQRIDFMINVHLEIIKYANSELTELENEKDRRYNS